MIWFTIWLQFFFRYFVGSVKLLEPVRFNRKTMQKTREIKKNLVSNLWCLHSSDAFKISQNTSSEQNLQEHGENLGSKLTNHKMTKFPERSEAYLFSLQEALCFLLQCYWFVYKKSLTSFVLNKHVHWFIFLHFDPVQIISLLWALHRVSLLSFTIWVVGL